MKNINNKTTAFSLIELSIVLIIIGLLVAGVTGGKSLIDSARSRALINELREYERAVWTFRAARDRFPGDVMNYGTFGVFSNYYRPDISVNSDFARPAYTYKKTDFSAPYNTGNFTPDYGSAPFVDLYTEGIIDFKPLGNTETTNKNSAVKATPNSKVIEPNNVFLRFYYTGAHSTYKDSQKPLPNSNSSNGIGGFGSIKESLFYVFAGASATKGMDPKILKQVDQKLDDGEHWNGRMRSSCYGKKSDGTASDTTDGFTDYDYAIENGKKCYNFHYAL